MPDTTLTSAELDELEALAKIDMESVRMWLLNSRLVGHEASAVQSAAVVAAASSTILRLISLARAGLEAGKADESMRESVPEVMAKLPVLPKDLFEMYPGMSANSHEHEVKRYAATALQSQADALAEARRMVALAEEAEEAAKDCFWAVYPTYIKATGKGISTEAAHTELSARATTAEASLATMREALEPFAEFGRRNTDEYHGWSGTQCQRERIVDWFGPSDFLRAVRCLSEGKDEIVDLEKLRRLEGLVRVFLDNDPDEPVADNGATVLELFRHNARRALGGSNAE